MRSYTSVTNPSAVEIRWDNDFEKGNTSNLFNPAHKDFEQTLRRFLLILMEVDDLSSSSTPGNTVDQFALRLQHGIPRGNAVPATPGRTDGITPTIPRDGDESMSDVRMPHRTAFSRT